MQKINVVCIGKLKEKFFSDAVAEYLKRLSRFAAVSVRELPERRTLKEEAENRADLLLSFSDMTFPHQLMRVVLCEQIYRAFMINGGGEYHK